MQYFLRNFFILYISNQKKLKLKSLSAAYFSFVNLPHKCDIPMQSTAPIIAKIPHENEI